MIRKGCFILTMKVNNNKYCCVYKMIVDKTDRTVKKVWSLQNQTWNCVHEMTVDKADWSDDLYLRKPRNNRHGCGRCDAVWFYCTPSAPARHSRDALEIEKLQWARQGDALIFTVLSLWRVSKKVWNAIFKGHKKKVLLQFPHPKKVMCEDVLSTFIVKGNMNRCSGLTTLPYNRVRKHNIDFKCLLVLCIVD